jgi:formamidopyrimidine-DNA glycosylase
VIHAVAFRGPFLHFRLSGDLDIVLNLMLAGRIQHQLPGARVLPHLCVSLALDDGSSLHIGDERLMAKLYVVPHGRYEQIPRFLTQGVDVLSPGFTPALFRDLVRRHGRKQVRVLLNDQTILSAIGNAYADEILFEARIHPKTFAGRCTAQEVDRLHAAIVAVLRRGINAVRNAGEPIEVKVRAHMRVRNRHGDPCPACGTTIRREGVRGHDVYFCPVCQPPSRKLFIDWRTLPPDPG